MDRIRVEIKKLERARIPRCPFLTEVVHRMRHIDWLGWWIIWSDMKRVLTGNRRIYTADEMETMRQVLLSGFEERHQSTESTFVTLAILSRYINARSVEGFWEALEDPRETIKTIQDVDALERDDYLKLLYPDKYL
jgi:hypothetical protein